MVGKRDGGRRGSWRRDGGKAGKRGSGIAGGGKVGKRGSGIAGGGKRDGGNQNRKEGGGGVRGDKKLTRSN